MSSLGYAAGGLGQGYAQAKDFQFQRQMKQREATQRDTQLGLEKSAQEHAVAQQHRELVKSALDGIDNILNSKDPSQTLTPGQRANLIAKRQGILKSNPDFDYGGEVAASEAQKAQTQQAGNNESADILSGGSGMNPSVAQQPATSNPSVAPTPPPTEAPQIGGQQVPGPYLPTNPQPPAAGGATPPAPPVQSGPGGSPLTDNSYSLNDRWESQADDILQQANDRTADISPEGRRALIAQSLAIRMEGVKARHEAAMGKLATAQTDVANAGLPYVAPQAEAGLGLTKAQTNLAGNEAGQVVPNAQSQRAVQGEQVASSKYQRGTVIPTQLHQAQQGLDIQRDAQRVGAFSAHAGAAEADKGMQLEFQKYGFEKKQFDTTRLGLLAGAAHTRAEALKMLADPGFNTQAFLKMVTENSHEKSPSGSVTPTGPTMGAQTRYEEAIAHGMAPTLGNNDTSLEYIITGKNAPWGNTPGGQVSGGGGGFDLNGYLADAGKRGVSAAMQVNTLKQRGIAPPPDLARRAAAEMRGGSTTGQSGSTGAH